MFKKILLASILIVIVNLLIFGAVNRTLAMENGTGTDQAGFRRNNEGEQTVSESGYGETNSQGNGVQGRYGRLNGNGLTAGESTAPILAASSDLMPTKLLYCFTCGKKKSWPMMFT